MGRQWTVWMCCRKFEVFESKEEAFEAAHTYSCSDNCHTPHTIEGPNGEDYSGEFKEYDRVEFRKSYDALTERREAAQRSLVGSVEVRSPGGSWYGERVYSDAYRDELFAEMREIFGPDRVRFIPAAD